jgi:hypothetical protein
MSGLERDYIDLIHSLLVQFPGEGRGPDGHCLFEAPPHRI